VLQVQ